MKEPEFSIIICPLDSGDLLKRTLDSLQWQIFKDFEVIIVKRNPSSELNILVEKYKKLFGKKLRHIDLENGSLIESINKGIKMAKGQYLSILEPGEDVKQNTLELALKSAQIYPQADVVYGVENIWEKSKRIKGVVNMMAKTLPIKNNQHSNLFYKKELHNQFGFYGVRDRVIEDYAFCLKAFYLGGAIVRPFDLG